MTNIIQADRLEPCPFCACLASIECHGSIFQGAPGYRIECAGKCHAMTCYWHTKAEAIAAWNTRPSPNIPEVGEGFDAAVQALEAWAEGFLGGDTPMRLRLTAKDLRRNKEEILSSLTTSRPLPLGYKDGLEAARQALQHASMTFHRYAKLHRDKATDEGDAKACANASMAEEMDRALEAIRSLSETNRHAS